jgi:hypothetical protein
MLPRYTNLCTGKRYWRRSHWSIRRLFSKNVTANNDDINDYLSTLGYTDPSMKIGMRNALQTVFGNQITLSQVKGFGEEGMFLMSMNHVIIFHMYDHHSYCLFSLFFLR